jgi:hypothetical protein
MKIKNEKCFIIFIQYAYVILEKMILWERKENLNNEGF